MVLIVDELARMRMFAAGVYAALGISSTYAFSLFAAHLRDKYKMSQSDITMISTVGNCCGYFSFPAGMLFDYAGPMVVISVSATLVLLGFSLFGLTFSGVINTPSATYFALYNAILYFGCPALDVSTIMPLMLQFPLDRGYTVLAAKTTSGLGTAVLMAYFNGWFRHPHSNNPSDNNYAGFSFFIGAHFFVVAVIALCVVRLPAYFPCAWRRRRLTEAEQEERRATLSLYMRQPASPRRLGTAVGLVLTLLVFLTTQSIATAYIKVTHGVRVAISVIALLLMVAFSVIALPFQVLGRYTPVRATSMNTIGEVVEENACPDTAGGDEAPAPAPAPTPPPQYRSSFWSNLLTIDLWCMWLTLFGVWGTGTVMIMNVAQIYGSINYGVTESSTLTLFITIISVGSAIGRMSMGYLDIVLTRRQRAGKGRTLTTVALPLCPLLMAVAFLLLAVLPAKALSLPLFLGGLGNGAGWGLGVLSFRMMYASDIGKHYNFGFSSGIVSTVLLNSVMFGGMYDAVAKRRKEAPSCGDPECVRTQMFILMGVNIIAIVAAAVAHVRFARFTAAELLKRNEPCEPLGPGDTDAVQRAQ
ncbi:hypothetical protein ERJ75_001624000 [Trypanosoma vivax]|nr:hypothetical protein ERJ75_001624000 [Trypanosoma vivax]